MRILGFSFHSFLMMMDWWYSRRQPSPLQIQDLSHLIPVGSSFIPSSCLFLISETGWWINIYPSAASVLPSQPIGRSGKSSKSKSHPSHHSHPIRIQDPGFRSSPVTLTSPHNHPLNKHHAPLSSFPFGGSLPPVQAERKRKSICQFIFQSINSSPSPSSDQSSQESIEITNGTR